MGFQGKDPATDFRGMGFLGLDNLRYFCEHHTDDWQKIVYYQAERTDSKDYPVAIAGINITSLLMDLLEVDTEPSIEGRLVRPILFDHPNAFEEIYCICFKLLDQTWDDMEASYMQVTFFFFVFVIFSIFIQIVH